MTSLPQRVLPDDARWPLFDTAASRAIEADALARTAPHALMQRAGLGVARLAMAVAPHARNVWVAAGPGNNGGDGLVAAAHLHRAGFAVRVTLLGDAARLPADAAAALADALAAGVQVSDRWPVGSIHLAIDALLGLGATRAPQGPIGEAVARLNTIDAPRIAVDLPTGVHADTGQRLGADAVRATHTLALLTLKPGLFTAGARDPVGEVWLDTLGVETAAAPSAWLSGAADAFDALPPRPHDSHKGRFGDLAVFGGAPGMTGAALLAARAASAAGAGRVFVALLDDGGPAVDARHPELMFRPRWWRSPPEVLQGCTAVCGCGGAQAVREPLPALLWRCPRLVLDADALNVLAADESLRGGLAARAARGSATVLTPHPLEAARLLGAGVADVQRDRPAAARELARRHGAIVLLKGSGSVVAAPDGRMWINPTGNALLASGGSGDVLAGWIGGVWAQQPDAGADSALRATLAAAWLHGRAADRALAAAPGRASLRAGELIEAMRRAAGRGID